MRTEQLPLYHDIRQLLNRIIDARENMPRGMRYDFGSHLMMLCVKCCELIRRANSDVKERSKNLLELDIEFGNLKMLLEVCQDRRVISINKMAEIVEQLAKIGRQINGWKKATLDKSSESQSCER